MSRALVLAVAVAGIAVPVGLGVYALSTIGPDGGEGVDAHLLAQAVAAESEPLDLAPPATVRGQGKL
jgi:hypothetical protein